MFVSGVGGTGKSFLIEAIRGQVKELKTPLVLLQLPLSTVTILCSTRSVSPNSVSINTTLDGLNTIVVTKLLYPHQNTHQFATALLTDPDELSVRLTNNYCIVLFAKYLTLT